MAEEMSAKIIGVNTGKEKRLLQGNGWSYKMLLAILSRAPGYHFRTMCYLWLFIEQVIVVLAVEILKFLKKVLKTRDYTPKSVKNFSQWTHVHFQCRLIYRELPFFEQDYVYWLYSHSKLLHKTSAKFALESLLASKIVQPHLFIEFWIIEFLAHHGERISQQVIAQSIRDPRYLRFNVFIREDAKV